MSRILLLVGLGGFIGSVSRFYCQQIVTKYFPSAFPYGTLTVNIVGCFLVGIIYALSEKGDVLSPEWRMFLATGICGGFTTFSAFSFESIKLMNDGEWLNVTLYVTASVLVGFLSTWLGISLIKSL